jgi:hypothetical protein
MKYLWLLLLMLCLGCSNRPKKTNIIVRLADSNRSVHISGFDRLVINDIARDSASEVWETLLPVYKMPADTDMKDYQNPQPGKYFVKDSLVVFTPDTSFKKGQVYFLRYYQYDNDKDAWQQIRDKKKLGSLSYRDLLFKY